MNSFIFYLSELYTAIETRNFEEAESICKKADRNVNFSRALLYVVKNELDHVYDMLIKYGATFNIQNNEGGEMLLSAVTKQNVALCEKILRNGITKNTKDCPYPSPSLKKAIGKIIENEMLEIYKLLNKYFDRIGFLIKLVNGTVIHRIIYKRNYNMLENLIRDGVDVNFRNNSGNFLIHTAAEIGDDSILNHLLRNNVSIKAKNYFHQTALHLAAKNGHKDVFDTLQQHGLNDSADRFGKTAEDYATENGHYEKLYVNYYDKYYSMFS